MTRTTCLLLALAAWAATTTYADARDGCGSGWYFNGAACVPQAGPRYGEGPVYAPQRYSYEGYRYPQNYGAPRPVRQRDGTMSCTGRGYTWQNGACRPYTGR